MVAQVNSFEGTNELCVLVWLIVTHAHTISPAGKQTAPTYAYQMVRTDSKEQKLDAFFGPQSSQQSQSSVSSPPEPMDDSSSPVLDQSKDSSSSSRDSHVTGHKRKHSSSVPGLLRPFRKRAHRKEVKLTSVRSLQLAVRGQQHKGESRVVMVLHGL